MTKRDTLTLLTGEVLEEEIELSLAQLCQVSRLPAERVFELVEFGIIEPSGVEPGRWRFRGVSLQRLHCAQRLQRDLGVNTAGVALALDLLEELEELRARVRLIDK